MSLSAVLWWGCGTSPPPSPLADAGQQDGAVSCSAADLPCSHDLVGPEDSGPLLLCAYPAEEYGLSVGQVLQPFVLATCDGEQTDIASLWCGSSVTIVHVSTAWCGLCSSATAAVQRDVALPLEGRGVRLVEVLSEGDHGVVASGEDCRSWSSFFDPPVGTYIPTPNGLDGPLQELLSVSAPPLSVVIDRHGVIRRVSNLAIPDYLEEDTTWLRELVEELLAEGYSASPGP